MVFVSAEHEGDRAIFKINLADKKLQRELVHHHKGVDISASLIYSHKSKKVVGYTPTRGNRSLFFWDDTLKSLQAGIDKSMPDNVNRIYDFSRDEQLYAVYTYGKKNPGEILLGDRNAKTLELIAEDHPNITPSHIPNKRYIHYQTRDQIEIRSIATLPLEKPKSPPPLMVLLHDELGISGNLGFTMLTTYFAHKGYAVLQPNWRLQSQKPTVSGPEVGEFGLSIHDDIEDGVKHLIDKNLVDPQRICIIGKHYGGYGAMMAAAVKPNLYRCAISIAGISDLVEKHKDAEMYLGANLLQKRLGNDKSQLKNTSPIARVESIKAPILLIHGARDPVNSVEQSRAMARALANHKKPHEYVEFEMGMHDLNSLDDRRALYRAMDEFLDKHLSQK